MKLSFFARLLLELSDVYDLHGGNPDLIEFPKDNLVASLMPAQKRIELSPRDDAKTSTRIRSLINDIRNKFRVAKVTQLGMNTFSIEMDPAENFEKVSAYIKQAA